MRRKNKHSKKSDRKSVWIILLLLLLLICTVSVSVWALFFRNDGPPLAPDYALRGEEDNAEKYEDDSDDEKLPQQHGGGAVGLTYSKDVVIDLSEVKAYLNFANPGKSNQNIMLQIVIQDTVILQSGLLAPGYRVSELDLFKNARLSPGAYDGKIVVYYYQTDTGEKAMLNTEIPLTITVVE